MTIRDDAESQLPKTLKDRMIQRLKIAELFIIFPDNGGVKAIVDIMELSDEMVKMHENLLDAEMVQFLQSNPSYLGMFNKVNMAMTLARSEVTIEIKHREAMFGAAAQAGSEAESEFQPVEPEGPLVDTLTKFKNFATSVEFTPGLTKGLDETVSRLETELKHLISPLFLQDIQKQPTLQNLWRDTILTIARAYASVADHYVTIDLLQQRSMERQGKRESVRSACSDNHMEDRFLAVRRVVDIYTLNKKELSENIYIRAKNHFDVMQKLYDRLGADLALLLNVAYADHSLESEARDEKIAKLREDYETVMTRIVNIQHELILKM